MPYKKSVSYGGNGGNAFADNLTETVKIKKITVRSGSYVDALIVTWTTTSGQDVTTQHGGGGGNPKDIELASDEHIVRIEGRSGAYIDQLTFFTDKGRTFGPYGGNGGNPFTPIIGVVGGFFGRSGSYIDQLGIFYPVN